MNNDALKQQFEKRLRENYEGFLKDWLQQEPEYLVSYAEEISAAKMLYNALPEVASLEDMERLLQFENPLEMVRDKWMFFDGVDMSGEITHVLCQIENDPALRELYEPNQGQPTPGMEVTMC